MAKRLATGLGESARAARLRLGLTQEEVAERLGMAPEVYGRLERGNMLPSVPTLRVLCLLLGMSANVALGTVLLGVGNWSPEVRPPEESVEMRRLMRRARALDEQALHVLSLLAAYLAKKHGRQRKKK
jgi:transcriptional regulator with XRE-family HTH domain